MTIRANHSQISTAIVFVVAVDVIEMKVERLTLPFWQHITNQAAISLLPENSIFPLILVLQCFERFCIHSNFCICESCRISLLANLW